MPFNTRGLILRVGALYAGLVIGCVVLAIAAVVVVGFGRFLGWDTDTVMRVLLVSEILLILAVLTFSFRQRFRS